MEKEAMSKISVNSESTAAQKFIAALGNKQWQTTDRMVEALDNAGFWNEEDAVAEALDMFKKDYVRRMVRSLRTKGGEKVFINVKRTTNDGSHEQVYKQETLFDVNDYRYAVQYYKGVGMHYIAEANRLAMNCRNRKLDEQMVIPFPTLASA